MRTDATSHQRLKEAAEKAKIELSSKTSTRISIPFVTADANGPKHLNMELSREKFDILNKPIYDRLIGPTKQALKDAKLDYKDINKVILVGGSTRIPAVQALVKDLFGKEGDKSVNPDECVAIGAAIQGGILAGEVKDILLLDVTPLTLGLETLGGVFTQIIDRNTTIPTKKSQIFSTAADSQTAVTIHILQGERPMAADNKTLGKFDLMGIPPAPRGIPQIEVSFDIDANGIVHVSAKDLGTGKQQSIKITATTNLSKEEIERMRQEAKANEVEDKKKKEQAETVNKADALVFQFESLAKELKGKIDDKELEAAKKEIDALKLLVDAKDKDVAKISAQYEIANKKMQEVSTKLYEQVAKQQQAAQGAGQAGAGNAKSGANGTDDNVVDAEFKDADEKKSK